MARNRKGLGRRDFMKTAAAAGGATIASMRLSETSLANNHPHPRPTSLDYLDRNQYLHNMDVHGQFFKGERRSGKMQLMAVGERRYLFQGGDIYDITDPLNLKMFNEDAFQGGQLQLAYNKGLGKWILMTGAGVRPTGATPEHPLGRHDNPSLAETAMKREGLRGVRFYDATDPANLKPLSQWSCDQGDPGRTLQSGGGTHRNYYDGGRYAYLDAAPDNSFIGSEWPYRLYSQCIQVIDVADPANPGFVSNWWVPGQRSGEEEARKEWREYGDKSSMSCLHGPIYVPTKVEDGGRYGYSSYGSHGVMIHDVTDPANLKLIGRWRPEYIPGPMIPFHDVAVCYLDRGFALIGPEAINPDCNEPYHDIYALDVRDPANMKMISKLPRPAVPESAPYGDFCDKRGRHGPHMANHQKAPGKANLNFIAYSYFNAGLQCYDISDPAKPRINAYFIPSQGGDMSRPGSWNRDTDKCFIEWDRKLIWVATNTGLYVLSTPELGKPVLAAMPVSEWTLPGLNDGHDA